MSSTEGASLEAIGFVHGSGRCSRNERASPITSTAPHQSNIEIKSCNGIEHSFIEVVQGYVDRKGKFNRETNAKAVARWHKTNSSAVVLGGNYVNGVASGDCLRFRELPLCTNQEEMDLLLTQSWTTLFARKKPHVLYTEHVFEHLKCL